MRPNLTYKFRLAAWLVTLAMLVVGSSVQASWQCANGTRCPNGMAMGSVVSSASISQAEMGRGCCPRCWQNVVKSSIHIPQGMSSSCMLRVTPLPIAVIRSQNMKSLPLFLTAMPPASNESAAAHAVLLPVPEPRVDCSQCLWRPHYGRAPPVLL